MQAPATQTWPASQACPQAPQFEASVERLEQLPLQYAAPTGHTIVVVSLPSAQPRTSVSAPASQNRFMGSPPRVR